MQRGFVAGGYTGKRLMRRAVSEGLQGLIVMTGWIVTFFDMVEGGAKKASHAIGMYILGYLCDAGLVPDYEVYCQSSSSTTIQLP